MSLRETLRDAILTSTAPVSPHVLAEQATAGITENAELRAALAEAAPYMARALIVETRPSTPAPTSAKSWKRDAIRQAEQRRRSELDALYATGDGTYLRLGAFNYDQLVALADGIQTLAEKHAAKASRIRALAEAVKAAGVATVDDLDAATLDSLGVAA